MTGMSEKEVVLVGPPRGFTVICVLLSGNDESIIRMSADGCWGV